MQHPWLIKEPNVNDQGFFSYVYDQEYLVVIYVRTYDNLGSKSNDYILRNVSLFYSKLVHFRLISGVIITKKKNNNKTTDVDFGLGLRQKQ